MESHTKAPGCSIARPFRRFGKSFASSNSSGSQQGHQTPWQRNPRTTSLSPRDEREILDTFRESFQHDFPNPQRIGCPGGEVLKALAWRRKLDNPEAVVTHIGKCSPCFQEHRVFLQQYKSRQRLYRLAAVAVLVIGVGLWISWKLMRGPGLIVPEPPPIVKTPPPEQPPAQTTVPPELEKQKPPEVQVAVLDLRKRGITRGENNKPAGDLNLPKGRLKLSIYLPFGSEVGQYEVRISGRSKQVATAKGRAVMRNHITVLDVEVDTGAFEAGNYSLATRQVGWGWYRYPVNVK